MAYDEDHGQVVLFGGGDCVSSDLPRSTSGTSGETWTWDGTDWTLQSPATAPSPRSGAAMAYDVARHRAVLYGGYTLSGFGVSSETWEWDGATWTQRMPAHSPGSTNTVAMTYDRQRQRIVLLSDCGNLSTCVSEWDGTDWTNLSVPFADSPPSRHNATLVDDERRQRVVLFGGADPSSSAIDGDVWDWDGQTWTQRQPNPAGPSRTAAAGVYDVLAGRVSVFGGSTTSSRTDVATTWTYGFGLARPLDVCVAAVDADLDGLAGCADPDCYGWCSPLCTPGTTCTPTPGCGDGACGPLENQVMCPADCVAP